MHYSFRYVTRSYYLNKELCSIVNRVHYSFRKSPQASSNMHHSCKSSSFCLMTSLENFIFFVFYKSLETKGLVINLRKVNFCLLSRLLFNQQWTQYENIYNSTYFWSVLTYICVWNSHESNVNIIKRKDKIRPMCPTFLNYEYCIDRSNLNQGHFIEKRSVATEMWTWTH